MMGWAGVRWDTPSSLFSSIPYRVPPYHHISPYPTSSQTISFHVTAFQLMSSHPISSRPILSHHILSGPAQLLPSSCLVSSSSTSSPAFPSLFFTERTTSTVFEALKTTACNNNILCYILTRSLRRHHGRPRPSVDNF